MTALNPSSSSSLSFKHLTLVGDNFWNLRSSLVMMGVFDIGTHMSFVRLSSGKFLVIDCVDLQANAAAKEEVDELTDRGALIEAVIGVHPFHTLFFPAFHKLYPNAAYYGTPRHFRNFTDIPWVASLQEEGVRGTWESEGVFMRIPDGAEFVHPENDVHFSSVVLFHAPSKTIHVDDTFQYFYGAGCLLRCFGKKDGLMEFWPLEKGLDHKKDAPHQFKLWVEELIRDWDFDNICSAHNNNKIGGAKICLQNALTKANPEFDRLSKKWGSL